MGPVSPTVADAPIPFVWHPRTRRHVPSAEIWLGVRTPGTEVVERVDVIRDALIRAGHREVTARDPDRHALLAVHSPELLEHLRTIHDAWAVGGYATDPGQDRVVPYVFPTVGMLGGLPARRAAAPHARAGQFCYDTMTLIGPGTWDAAEAAAGAALTAVDLVAEAAWVEHEAGLPRAEGSGQVVPGTVRAPIAYALCRPPGHHATREAFGGSCYLNNAAIAAEALRARGARRVAILDVDAHHGNGTQTIFYGRGDVLYASVHVDPGAGWFPHFMGFADETGFHGGVGTNVNIPLPPRAGDDRWLAAVEELVGAAAAFHPDAVVVSLGVDAAVEDPESPLRVTREGIAATGVLLGGLGLPTVVVQEGGYHLRTLGALVADALAGIAEGAVRASRR
jgi:acetoin utilization deacetylase AcuC-like enzyme